MTPLQGTRAYAPEPAVLLHNVRGAGVAGWRASAGTGRWRGAPGSAARRAQGAGRRARG